MRLPHFLRPADSLTFNAPDMKKVMFMVSVLLLFLGCQREDLSAPDPALDFRAADKVSICHLDDEGFFHEIRVSINALPAHLAHGDYYPDNECGCFPMGLWHGSVVYSNGWTLPIHVTFNPDHTASVMFGDYPCLNENGVVWNLQSCDGDSFHYMEYDPCACSGCDVIVEKGDGCLYVHYTCYCGGTWMIEGVIYPG